ncbi:MAG: NAD-dependent epimerase/dehydratase family protein [Oceanospirillaceae bacterium]|nr:NAD-dependent epimerase/dehydratase family protein [Oceanospirillaceae bacterium]
MSLYLVTGAAGFIGSAIATKLLSEGHRVVTIDNLSTGFVSAIPKDCEFYEGDCQDPLIYEKIPQERYDAVYHIAGQSSGEISFDDPTYDLRTNAESTLIILKFCMANGCNRVLFASTMSVYGEQPVDMPVFEVAETNPQSFYGVGKLASEHYLRIYESYGIHTTSLRLFNVYGPGQNLENMRQGMVSIYLSQMIQTGHIHVKGSAERYRDLVYIDDVVEIFVGCESNSATYGEIINVSTGVKTKVCDLVDTLIAHYGHSVTVEYSGSTAGDIHGIYGDNNKLKSLFDIECVSVYSGTRKMLDWANGLQK